MKPTAYIVTGATSGIGAAIARSLLDVGQRVVNIDYRLPDAVPAGMVCIQADLTDAAQAQAAARQATDSHAIVGVVNNAGATRPGTIDTATLADLDDVVGLIGMTRTLAMELGGDGITVNAIAPGPIATELFMKSNPAGAPQTQRILDSIVVKRMGTPEDVARAAMFFLSPDNGFVTGQVLYVCGGTTLGVAPG